jgi:hypothetical protein
MKESYKILRISAITAKHFLDRFHYLHRQGFGFRSGYNFGLFNEEKILIGVAVFHCPSVPEIMQGAFGLERNDQNGFFELGRLAMNNFYFEKNLTSFFLSRAINMLKKIEKVRCIISYADAAFHKGYIYQALNFSYHGVTDSKCDFWIFKNGKFEKHQRGPVKNIAGEWRPRSQKHRYLIVFDKKLKVLWQKMEYPKGGEQVFNNSNSDANNPFRFIPKESAQFTLFN